MEKRKAYSILAVIASLIFSLIYFFVFSSLTPSSENILIQSIDQEDTINNEKATTLYWIQLGIFSQASSYSELIEETKALNLNPLTINTQGKIALVVGCTSEESVHLENINLIVDAGLEYMPKEKTDFDEIALPILREGSYEILLEEWIY